MTDTPVTLLGGNEIRALLDTHRLAPTKRRGQNFVVDPNTVRRIVRDAGVQPGDAVVEVGPGLGSLTLALVEASATVTAIELDHGLASALRNVVAGRGVSDKVTVVEADAVGFVYPDVTGDDGAAPVMVANLPYNVATPILMTAITQRRFRRFHLMVQKEVGERWVASPDAAAFGAVSVKIALFADAKIAGGVSRQAFFPAPRVDSVTVDVVPHERYAPALIGQAVRLVDAGFARRRKTLRNALGAAGVSPSIIDQTFASLGLSATVRAEQLVIAQWLELAEAMSGELGGDDADDDAGERRGQRGPV